MPKIGWRDIGVCGNCGWSPSSGIKKVKLNNCCKAKLNAVVSLTDIRLQELEKQDKKFNNAPKAERLKNLGVHLQVIAWQNECERFKALVEGIIKSYGG